MKLQLDYNTSELNLIRNFFTEDENGNEILEDITEYEAHQILQQMIRLTGGK